MAAQVHLAVLSRLVRHDGAVLTVAPATDLTRFAREGEVVGHATHDVALSERPPLLELEEYLRGRLESDRSA